MEHWFWCWLPLLLLWFILYMQKKRRTRFLENRIKRRKEGIKEMEETIRSFMNRPVVITLLSDAAEEGEIISYNNGWITLRKNKAQKAINCDYIVKIEPKKQKKK